MSNQFEKYYKEKRRRKYLVVMYRICIRYLERMETLSREDKVYYIEFLYNEMTSIERENEWHRENDFKRRRKKRIAPDANCDYIYSLLSPDHYLQAKDVYEKSDKHLSEAQVRHYLTHLTNDYRAYRLRIDKDNSNKGHKISVYRRREALK